MVSSRIKVLDITLEHWNTHEKPASRSHRNYQHPSLKNRFDRIYAIRDYTVCDALAELVHDLRMSLTSRED
jgi:cupin superfamily acireductone dioxygenase involved in methionine salvage